MDKAGEKSAGGWLDNKGNGVGEAKKRRVKKRRH